MQGIGAQEGLEGGTASTLTPLRHPCHESASRHHLSCRSLLHPITTSDLFWFSNFRVLSTPLGWRGPFHWFCDEEQEGCSWPVCVTLLLFPSHESPRYWKRAPSVDSSIFSSTFQLQPGYLPH